MTRLRLKRIGSKGRPYYRVVVADQRSPRDGKVIEEIGWYNPRGGEDGVRLNLERVQYWLKVGAQPSDSVRSVFESQNVLERSVASDSG